MKKKPTTLYGKQVFAAIERGDLDEDLRFIRNACNQRMRVQKQIDNYSFEVGDLVRVKVADSYLPKYVDGAICEIIGFQRLHTREDNKLRNDEWKAWRTGGCKGAQPTRPPTGPISYYRGSILSLQHTPRGGPNGSAPKFVVDGLLALPPEFIEPVDVDAWRQRLENTVREILEEHGVTDP
jgi:hypothetical protein